MKRRVLSNIFIVVAILLVSISPALAQADEVIEEPLALPNIIISEVQTNGDGTGTTNQEFVELYNNSQEIINLLDFKLVYVTSSGSENDLFIFTEPLMFLPETFLLGKLASAPDDFLQEIEADFTYIKGSGGIAASAGGLKLIDSSGSLIDEVHWTSSASSETPAVVSLSGGQSAQRYYLDDELVIDTEDNFVNEFIVKDPTPGDFLYEVTPPPVEDEPVQTPPIEQPTVQPTPLDNPKIYLNELFIDPASPQLDSQDEFVEIYNPNNQRLDISDYVISAGLTTTYKHTLPKGTFINANGYLVIKSVSSSLTLANSGGKVTLTDNQNRQIDSVDYQDAEAGAAWAKSTSGWQWTVQPTPGAVNVIKQPVRVIKSTSSSYTKKSTTSSKSLKTNFTNAPPIKINEIFPDPSSPQKDSQDEFIELYNPYDYPINITDYAITSGATRTYKHTIKAPANIPARGYYTVTSADTSLSLTNSGGKVTLINNLDKQIDSVDYPEAIPGSSWAFIDGKWQWTASPTKNAANKLSGLIGGLNSNKDDSMTQVSSAVVAGTDDTPLVPAPQPLSGWLLAVLGVAAICYAAYEYRFEARNYYYKYSRLRSAR